MKIAAVLIISFLLLPGHVFAHEGEAEHKSGEHRHKEYEKIKNPLQMTRESIEKGEALYKKHCAACHGDNGKGKVAPDLTAKTMIHGDSDGEIFKTLSDGVKGTPMKGYSKELAEKERWSLVNYIKSLRRPGSKEKK